MTDEKAPDHSAEAKEDVMERLVAIMHDASFIRPDFDELLGAARKRFEQLVEAEIERDRWDELDREY